MKVLSYDKHTAEQFSKELDRAKKYPYRYSIVKDDRDIEVMGKPSLALELIEHIYLLESLKRTLKQLKAEDKVNTDVFYRLLKSIILNERPTAEDVKAYCETLKVSTHYYYTLPPFVECTNVIPSEDLSRYVLIGDNLTDDTIDDFSNTLYLYGDGKIDFETLLLDVRKTQK